MSLIGPDPFPIAELGVIIAKETTTATKTLRFLVIRPLLRFYPTLVSSR